VQGGRGSKGNAFYGSPLAGHDRFVELTLRGSERITRDNGETWHYGSQTLVEIAMTGAQFAEFLTTPNSGMGTPCTITFLHGEGHIPGIDGSQMVSDIQGIVDSFTESQQEGIDELKALIDELEETLKPRAKPPNVKAREELLGRARKAHMEAVANRPFALEQFVRATENVAGAMKSEVDTFLTQSVHHLGVKALGEKLAAGIEGNLSDAVTKALTEGGDE